MATGYKIAVKIHRKKKFIKYAEYSRELDIHKTQLLIIQAEIFEAINTVDDNVLRAILMARYINFDKWEQNSFGH